MINIADAVRYSGVGKPETRLKAYGHSLTAFAEGMERIVCLSADLTSQTEVDIFRSAHPNRFFSMGMAEQNMVGVAAGLARAGDIPFAHSFACFISRRAFDQIVNAVAYPHQNVKLVGVMPGISSPGGASHQAIDDLAIMRATPNMTVIDLGEATEVSQAVRVAAEIDGPVYLRLRRGVLPVIFDESKFTLEVGQSYVLRQGKDIGIITSGLMTERALQAAALLADIGVQTTVLHVPSIKPIDEEGILEVAENCRALLTLDNHNVIGGLGSAVAEVLVHHRKSIPFQRIGIPDVYGKAGTNPYLYRMFGFDPDQIAQTALLHLEGYSELKVENGSVEPSEKAGWGGNWSEA